MEESMHDIIKEAVERVKKEHGVSIDSISVEWIEFANSGNDVPHQISIESTQTNG